MDLDYFGESRIKLERVCPVRKNACRLSVATNTVNYFVGRKVLDTESAFIYFDQRRQRFGLPSLDLDRDVLMDEEIRSLYTEFCPGIGDCELSGLRAMDFSFWSDIVNAGFLIAPDHQMLYVDPKINVDKNFDYFPQDLVNRAINDPEYSYENFWNPYAYYLNYKGSIDEGHIDIVLDVLEHHGIKYVVLGNFDEVGNDHPIAVPWNLFRYYLPIDWAGPPIRRMTDFPNEAQYYQMMNTGSVDIGGNSLYFGTLDIYYPEAQRSLLEKFIDIHLLKK